MVAEGARAPEMLLEPEGRRGERVVLGRSAALEPYGAEPGKGSQQPIVGYPGLVVPDEAAAEDRKIRHRGDEHDRGEADEALQAHELRREGRLRLPRPAHLLAHVDVVEVLRGEGAVIAARGDALDPGDEEGMVARLDRPLHTALDADHRIAQEREAVGRVVPGDGVEVVGAA